MTIPLPNALLEAGSMNRDELLDLLRTHKAIL